MNIKQSIAVLRKSKKIWTIQQNFESHLHRDKRNLTLIWLLIKRKILLHNQVLLIEHKQNKMANSFKQAVFFFLYPKTQREKRENHVIKSLCCAFQRV